jgi:hypothetical protein
MRLTTVALALALSVATFGVTQGNEIYKWVDAEGNVHFGDRPSGVEGEEVVPIDSRPTDPAVVQQEVQAIEDWQTARAEAIAAAPKGPTAEERAAEAADRKQKCDMYTARLETFITKRHLYRELENGERYYLTEDEMRQAEADVQAKIDEFCNN